MSFSALLGSHHSFDMPPYAWHRLCYVAGFAGSIRAAKFVEN